MGDVTSDTVSRFSVFVPSPKARINLGKPDLDAPFGYTGMSLQSDVHLLIDVNKVALFQSGSHACWQVGGKWLQWSNANMFMASTASTTVAADQKVLLAAGAGQGQITSLDHGLGHVTPRVVDYNPLQLHYRVDEIHNGLKSLFYGPTWQVAEMTPQLAQRTDYLRGYAAGGFLDEMQKHFKDLGLNQSDMLRILAPLEWEGDHAAMTGPASAYAALAAFDPYPFQPFSGPFSSFYASVVQVLNWLHRFVDVMKKLMLAVTDNFIGKRIQNLIAAWGDAQEGFNSALNVADLARYDRSTGKFAENGGAWNLDNGELGNAKARLPVESPATPAKLTGAPGPFHFYDEPDTVIHVYDAESGTARAVDFADLLPQTRAEITLAAVASLHRITVAATAAGTLVLDGTSVAYTPASANLQASWGALPAGFAWDPAYTSVRKSDGSAFTASASGGVTSTDGGSFTSADTLTVVVDGTSRLVTLTTVKGDTAAARATTLAAAINAAAPGTATASGDNVVIQSLSLGPLATISASSPVLSKLGAFVGAASARGRDHGGTITVAQLVSRLTGAGRFSVSGDAEAVLTHNDSGATSYLEIRGALVASFFGSNPAVARGEAKASRVGSGFFQSFADMRSVQYEMAKWPEDLRNQFRPVTEALGDVVAVADRIKGVADNLIALATGGLSPPQRIGLIAGDGITLGSKGPVYGVGNNITFVATDAGKPDDRKYIPGIEAAIEKVLNYDPGAVLAESFKPKPKKTPAPSTGHFRVVSSASITMTAADKLTLVAKGTAGIHAGVGAFVSVGKLGIASRTASVTVQGKLVTIGDHVQDTSQSKQGVTDWVKVRSARAIELFNTDTRAKLEQNKIVLGKAGAAALAIDEAKPRLLLDLTAGAEKASLGFVEPAGTFGFTVKHDGNIDAHAKTTFKLGVPNDSGITCGGQSVEVAGSLKVGGVLLVRGDGVFSAGAATGMRTVAIDARKIAIPGEYAGVIAAVGVINTAIDAIGESWAQAQHASRTALSPFDRPVFAEQARLLAAQLRASGRQRAALHLKQQSLLAEAKLVELTPQQVGYLPAHDDLFG